MKEEKMTLRSEMDEHFAVVDQMFWLDHIIDGGAVTLSHELAEIVEDNNDNPLFARLFPGIDTCESKWRIRVREYLLEEFTDWPHGWLAKVSMPQVEGNRIYSGFTTSAWGYGDTPDEAVRDGLARLTA